MGANWHTAAAILGLSLAVVAAAALQEKGDDDGTTYHHVWPPMTFGWRIVVGTLIALVGAAFGSVGGVGGGGIFVPMLVLIIGFDSKSAVAISKCMIMGTSFATVCYNLRLKHPTLDRPLIDYDLALLIQPMLMLGISIGVIFSVIFPDWLVTVLLLILFLGTSIKSFMRGVRTWKQETIIKKTDAARRLEQLYHEPQDSTTVPAGPADADAESNDPSEVPQKKKKNDPSEEKKSFLNNIYWKEFGLVVFVWMTFLGIQVAKNHTATCSVLYWFLTSLQIPVSIGVSMYEAHSLKSGKRVLPTNGNEQRNLKRSQLLVYCLLGILAGLLGGLLGVGGGFIMGPLFLELNIPPQVSSATSTFAMMFSSSMSVVEFYLLHRFPVPYAAYGLGVASVAAIAGQNSAMKLTNWLGRTSVIIFILAFMIFISALTLGIVNIVRKMERHQNMGFENLCKYGA